MIRDNNTINRRAKIIWNTNLRKRKLLKLVGDGRKFFVNSGNINVKKLDFSITFDLACETNICFSAGAVTDCRHSVCKEWWKS